MSIIFIIFVLAGMVISLIGGFGMIFTMMFHKPGYYKLERFGDICSYMPWIGLLIIGTGVTILFIGRVLL